MLQLSWRKKKREGGLVEFEPGTSSILTMPTQGELYLQGSSVTVEDTSSLIITDATCVYVYGR